MVVGQFPILLASSLPPLQFSTEMCSLPATAQGYQTPPGSMMNSPCYSPLTPPSSPPSNAVFTYTSVPTNFVTGMPVVPLSPTLIRCKDQQQNTQYSFYQCTQPSIPSSNLVPSQPRTVLQCQVCSMASNPTYNNDQIYNIPPSLSIAQTICSANVLSPWKQSYGMEHVWRREFQKLFQSYTAHTQHVWTLLPVTERPGGIWYENVDSAKVRFCCDSCGHGWTSMKGRVAFWFILNYATNEGVVCLKLYGQQCDRCKRGDYETAMWYPEEVFKVMANIYNKVGEVYYGFQQVPYHKTRRPGKPRTPHNGDLCQACKDGVCAERR